MSIIGFAFLWYAGNLYRRTIGEQKFLSAIEPVAMGLPHPIAPLIEAR